MKTDGTHPGYNDDATITCSCGAKFKVGSTQKELDTELCSKCHPFYTGQQKLVDTAGRVDKFKKKMEMAKKLQEEAAKKAPKKRRATMEDKVNAELSKQMEKERQEEEKNKKEKEEAAPAPSILDVETEEVTEEAPVEDAEVTEEATPEAEETEAPAEEETPAEEAKAPAEEEKTEE